MREKKRVSALQDFGIQGTALKMDSFLLLITAKSMCNQKYLPSLCARRFC